MGGERGEGGGSERLEVCVGGGRTVGSKEVLGVECFFASGLTVSSQRFSACVLRDIH